ncbi:MAG: putative bifunctional diguanylate cyclase/phosphodiesterase, partial [Longimicrobiales bacterium]
ALSTSGYDTPDDVLRDADAAMYRAKSSGRAHYEIFDLEMHRRALVQLQLESDLRDAIERREFAVHYQPVIALDAGNVMGMEALVRWRHPSRGTLLPGEFIGVAEQSGAIVEIGWYVLREACRQMQSWRERFPRSTLSTTMSVNLSARQFVQPDLLVRIDEILAETKLDPSCLRLELTESAVNYAPDLARGVLRALAERGIRICLDDFGTGYSSLQQLKQLPLSDVKVDRSFVRGLGSDTDSAGMVQTIVALGNSLSVDTIAEGVETPEELDELRALGMKFAQGYLFSTPLSAEHAERLLTSGEESE